ncbi:hypothetical protein NQ318_002032 [Aromia moschata]|uniref:Inactive serine protease scarface clip-domain domain-containing protein n=1 Tax=Aromia moschata TaxID=1265417 RepID=A0AAV8Z4G3_9CUCU|nr:hypothetical protein NQ318_002032 [Aromia moschata]
MPTGNIFDSFWVMSTTSNTHQLPIWYKAKTRRYLRISYISYTVPGRNYLRCFWSPDGSCESPPTTPRPCPPGTTRTVSGSCEAIKTPSCPFGTILRPDGSCGSINPPTTPKPCPPGTILTASGLCEAVVSPTPGCPFGTIQKPDGSCETRTTPAPPRPCPPGTIRTGSGLCEAVVSPTPGCPFGTIQKPDGSCETRSTPAPPRPCPPGTIRTGSGLCEAIVSPTPGCPFGTIQRPDGSCETRTTPAPPRPCPPGTIRTGSGLCEAVVSPTPGCPFGTIQRPDGSCETRTTPAPPRPCPPGTIRTGSGLCEAIVSPTPGCPFGTIQRPDGSCETRSTPAPPRPCPPGTIRTGSGLCEAVVSPTPGCPFGTIQRPDGSCETRTTPAPPRPCPPGTIRTGSGLCEAVVSPTPGCPFGTIQRPDGSCETRTTPAPPRPCPPGTIRTGSGLCEAIVSPTPGCPFGTIQRPDGSCETRSTPAPPRPCPPGTIRTGSGLCEALRTISCPFGTVQRPDGSCEARTPPPVIQKCPPGTVLTASGLCEATRIPISCPFGTIQRPDGTCEQPPIVSSTPRPCPTGTFLTSSGLCESPVTPSPTTPGYTYPKPCPPGTFKTPAGLCETPIVTTPRPQCPFGTYLTPSGSCETPRPTSPKPPPSTTASREYLPPVTPTQYVPTVTQKPHQPSVTPAKPFRPSITSQQPQVTPSRPFQPSVTPARPFQPSSTPQVPSTTIKPNYPQVTTPKPYEPPITTQRPYPSSTLPNPFVSTPATYYPVPQCKNGFIPDPRGNCVSRQNCPPGSKLSASGQYCENEIIKPRPSCGPGQILSTTGACIYAPQSTPSPTSKPPTCGPGQVFSPTSGKCEYSSSPRPRPRPTPRPSSTPGYEYTKPITPLCEPGQLLSASGSCVYTPHRITTSTPRPKLSCGQGQVPNPSGIGCIYPKTPRPTFPSLVTKPTVSCPFGTKLSPITQECVEQPQRVSCRPGQIPSSSGSGCEYPKTPKPTFPEVTTKQSISCPFGAKLSPITKECITTYPSSTTRPTTSRQCPDGQYNKTVFTVIKYLNRVRVSKAFFTIRTFLYRFHNRSASKTETVRSWPNTDTHRPISRPTPAPSCGSGQILSSSGICVYSFQSTPKPTPIRKQCASGQVISPSGFCVYSPSSSSTCGPNQILSPSGNCIYDSRPRPTKPTISCGPGQELSSTGSCIYPIKPIPTTTPNLSTGYEYPKPTVPFPAPSTTKKPTDCGPGQGLSPSGMCTYTTPSPSRKPSCPLGQVLSSSGSSIPEEPDKVDQGTNIESIKIATNPPPTSPPNRPNINVEQNNSPPVGCAAALKCVQEIYCTAEGFVSPVPVVLTKEQELLRAPTTECKDLETGIIGKCCRDLNYKDPWPSANLVNGVDNGQYKEDNFYGQSELLGSNRLTRSFNATGGDRPRVRTSVVSINAEDDHTNCGERHHDTKPLGEGPIDAKFAEYPWQAMILRDSNRSLLCGGAIIRKKCRFNYGPLCGRVRRA